MLSALLQRLFPSRQIVVAERPTRAPATRGYAAPFAAFLGRRSNVVALAQAKGAKRGDVAHAVRSATARERARLAAIMTSKAAASRRAAAAHLAFETSTPAAAAIGLLESMRPESVRERLLAFTQPVGAESEEAEAKRLAAQVIAAGDRIGVV